MILDTTTRTLQMILSGAVTTNELPIVVGFIVGILPQSLLRKAQTSVSNGGTAVTILSAPSAKESETVTFISIRNADTASATVTVRYNDNATIREIITATLAVDDTLIFTEEEGFKVIDSTGSIKSTGGGGGGGGGSDIGARVTHASAQSIISGSGVIVAFDTERWDTDTMHDNVINNSRLTATTAGKYVISAHIKFASNNTGIRSFSLRVNGTDVIAVYTQNSVTDSVNEMSISTIYEFSATDYVEVQAFQNSGGNLDITKDNLFSPEFAIQKILG